ncbi:hypothetical protein [Streptomyces sp. AN091965]|uniref:hypothetical protein n=1 Tax=Streptomyces sp. AN091965 TaxID=2927803 RepID=UPI001F5FFC69|nr:hypothetical protein [Streptomyces sp. AN091965]MCI3929203.1 hypothetical protein [Streptomyces sp. AN091965]
MAADERRAAPPRVPEPAGEGAVLAAREYAARHGEEHGWSVYVRRGVHRALGRVLTGLPPDGQRVRHTELTRQLAGAGLPLRRTAEVLAAMDMLHHDRRPAARDWVERQTGALPAGFTGDLRDWLLWLLDGDARTRPRALGTLHSYFGAVRPVVTRWARDRGQLREITREDVTDAVAGLRGSQYTAAVTTLRSLFRHAKKNGRVFTDPMRGTRVGRRAPGSALPMTDAEITSAQVTAANPATRLAVVLAAVHAARGETIRALQLDDLDFHQGRITVDGNVQPMGALTRAALRAWLTERRTRWSSTLNRHVMVSRQTANGTGPVSTYFLKRQLTLNGVSLDRIRVDRVLGEALATGADPLHLTTVFGLSETTATKYASLACQHRREPSPAAED